MSPTEALALGRRALEQGDPGTTRAALVALTKIVKDLCTEPATADHNVHPEEEESPVAVSEVLPIGPAGWFLSLNSVNDLQQATIAKTIAHAKRARWANVIVRKDGVETKYEADWIKHLIEVVPQVADRRKAKPHD